MGPVIRPQHQKRGVRAGKPCALLFLAPLMCVASALAQVTNSDQAQSCQAAARKALGPSVSVLKCGHLTGRRVLECVAAVRLRHFRDEPDGIPVSKLLVLERVSSSNWTTELTVDEVCARNNAGYLGNGYIIDVPEVAKQIAGYRVGFSNYIDAEHKKPGFTILLSDLRWDENQEAEGTGWEIAWNASVGRFQLYETDEDPPGFRPETKHLQRLSEWRKLHGCGGAQKPPCDK